jgi:protein-S-isoprenylcysteine O-methyltransferase Ste14
LRIVSLLLKRRALHGAMLLLECMKLAGGVARAHGASFPQKILFAILHGLIVAACGWLVLAGGFATVRDALDLPANAFTNRGQAMLVWGCGVLYFCRHMLTLFVLLKRQIRYSEAIGLSVFFAVFHIGFCLLAADPGIWGTWHAPWSVYGAVVLVLAGSVLNSGAEMQRHLWKKNPANKGHCYTDGLFRYSAHINYFGDAVLFFGWALLSQSVFALAVPVFITVSFIMFHIPALDGYLQQRYGQEFSRYAGKTAKFVPFLY